MEDLASIQLELEKRLAAQKEEFNARIDKLSSSHAERTDALLRELSDARTELRIAKDVLAADFEKTRLEAADVAVGRTLALFSEAKNIIQVGAGVLIAVAVGAGYMAYSSLQSTTAKFVGDKVKDWLSVSSQDSPVKATLEDLRNHAVLDAWTVKLARQAIDARAAYRSLGLSNTELARLRDIMLNPASSRADFLDAARLITVSRGMSAGLSVDPDIFNVAQTILTKTAYGDERRGDLLVAWWKDASILPMTKAMLETRDGHYDSSWRRLAFKNLARTSRPDAERLARELVSDPDAGVSEEAASFLAGALPLDAALQKWLTNDKVTDPDRYEAILAGFAERAAAGFRPSEAELAQASAWLLEAVRHGARLRLSSNGAGNDLAWEKQAGDTTFIRTVDNAGSLLRNEALLTRVFRKIATRMPELTTAVAALEVPDGNGMLASIETTLGAASSLTLKDQARALVKSDTVGPIRVHAERQADVVKLLASWRDANGEMKSGEVVTARLDDASFAYAYDREKVDALDMRRIDQYFP
ncbi:hypothetical protein [Luteibacter jiangsuensis]